MQYKTRSWYSAPAIHQERTIHFRMCKRNNRWSRSKDRIWNVVLKIPTKKKKKNGSFPAFEPLIPSNWSGQQQQQLRFAYISWQIKVKRVILRVVVQHSPGKPANCRIMFSIKLINAICPGALYQTESQLGCFPLSDFVLLLRAFQHRWTRQGKHSRQTEQHCYDK
jgi:hypothetical protein